MLKTLVGSFSINVLLASSLHCSIEIAVFFFFFPLVCGSFLYEHVNVCMSGALSPTASQTTNPQSASHMLNSESRRGN